MIKVYVAQNPTEAHLVKGLLESEGIGCEVKGEALFGARGELPMTPETAPSVWIFDESLFLSARQIIKDYESTRYEEDSETEIWICQTCGEESEGQFGACWNCGTVRAPD